MKSIQTVIVLSALFLPGYLFAARQDGVMAEFRAVEDAIRAKSTTDAAKLKTLEINLVRAMKLALTRRFYNTRDEVTKDLSAATITYESPISETIYYVKYRNYIVRFDFARNPEEFDQSAVYEKFLIISDDLKTNINTGSKAPSGDTGTAKPNP